MNALNRLDDQIASHFNLSELQDLCFKLDINFENLAGSTLNDKTLELVRYCKRHRQLNDLLALLAELRPMVTWPNPVDITTSPERLPTEKPSPGSILRRLWFVIPLLGVIVVLIWRLWPASNSSPETIPAGAQPSTEAIATSVLPSTRVISEDQGSDSMTQGVEETPVVVLEPDSFPTQLPSLQLLSEERLVSSPGRSLNPAVVSDLEGGLHLVWWDNTARSGEAGDIFYMYRPAGGDWGEIERLTDETLQLLSEFETTLRLRPDGAVCVFFADANAGLQTRCRQDGVWTLPEGVGSHRGFINESDPQFDSDGQPYVVHRQYADEIQFEDMPLSDGLNGGVYPELAIDSAGIFHIVWLTSEFPYRLIYRQSSDKGNSWSEAEVLTEENTQPDLPFTLMADPNGRVHLAWQGWDGGHFYRAWSAATGWGQVEKLADQFENNCISVDLQLAPNGDLIFAWQGFQGVFVTTRPAGDNQTWAPPFQVSPRQCRGQGPALAVLANGHPFVVYSDADDDEVDLYGAELVAP